MIILFENGVFRFLEKKTGNPPPPHPKQTHTKNMKKKTGKNPTHNFTAILGHIRFQLQNHQRKTLVLLPAISLSNSNFDFTFITYYYLYYPRYSIQACEIIDLKVWWLGRVGIWLSCEPFNPLSEPSCKKRLGYTFFPRNAVLVKTPSVPGTIHFEALSY